MNHHLSQKFMNFLVHSKEYQDLSQYIDEDEFLEQDTYDKYEPNTQLLNQESQNYSSTLTPILSKSVNDLIEFRYKKKIVSYIHIDSKNRSKDKTPDDYTIELNQLYYNIESIRLIDMNFKNILSSIGCRNDTITFITNDPHTSEFSEYTFKIPFGNYTLSSFVSVVERTVNQIPINKVMPYTFLEIDPFTRKIVFFQRLEELPVIEFRTTKNSNAIDFVISSDGVTPGNTNCCISDTEYIFKPCSESYPIIFSNLKIFGNHIAGISVDLIENQTFVPAITTNENHFTCASTSFSGGQFIYTLFLYKNKQPIFANRTATFSLSTPENIRYLTGHDKEVKVGRALRSSLRGSFVSFLGIQSPSSYKFIHTNLTTNGQIKNTLPWEVIGDGELALYSQDYVFMKIDSNTKDISDNFFNAKHRKDYENLFFAKINLSKSIPGTITNTFTGGYKIFYNSLLDRLNFLHISFYDCFGELLTTCEEHNFTLEITEIQETLKETLINTKIGDVTNTGV